MTPRNLVSPVIIRPKHGAFKGVPLVAARDGYGVNDRCAKCVAQTDEWRRCRDIADDALGDGCVDGRYHYEHAEVKHDKG